MTVASSTPSRNKNAVQSTSGQTQEQIDPFVEFQVELAIEHALSTGDDELVQLMLERLSHHPPEQFPSFLRVRYYSREMERINVLTTEDTLHDRFKLIAQIKNHLTCLQTSISDYLKEPIDQDLRNTLHDAFNISKELSVSINSFLSENSSILSQRKSLSESMNASDSNSSHRAVMKKSVSVCKEVHRFCRDVSLGPTKLSIAAKLLLQHEQSLLKKRKDQEKVNTPKAQSATTTSRTVAEASTSGSTKKRRSSTASDIAVPENLTVLSLQTVKNLASHFDLNFDNIVDETQPSLKRFKESREITSKLKQTSDKLLKTNRDPLDDTLANLSRVQKDQVQPVARRKLNAPHESAVRVKENYLRPDDEEEEQEDPLAKFRKGSPVQLTSPQKKQRDSELAKKVAAKSATKKRARSSDGDDQQPAGKRARKNLPYTPEEIEALKEGIGRFGEGKWSMILKAYAGVFNPSRNGMSLRDKYRNLQKSNLI